VSRERLYGWLETPLGMVEFLAVARGVLSWREFELMLKWVSPRGRSLSRGECDRCEDLAIELLALIVGRTQDGDGVAERNAFRSVED
jgi:hypothetical protein